MHCISLLIVSVFFVCSSSQSDSESADSGSLSTGSLGSSYWWSRLFAGNSVSTASADSADSGTVGTGTGSIWSAIGSSGSAESADSADSGSSFNLNDFFGTYTRPTPRPTWPTPRPTWPTPRPTWPTPWPTRYPVTAEPVTSAPLTSQPVTSQPVTSAPVETPAPITPTPVTQAPVVTPEPAGVVPIPPAPPADEPGGEDPPVTIPTPPPSPLEHCPDDTIYDDDMWCSITDSCGGCDVTLRDCPCAHCSGGYSCSRSEFEAVLYGNDFDMQCTGSYSCCETFVSLECKWGNKISISCDGDYSCRRLMIKYDHQCDFQYITCNGLDSCQNCWIKDSVGVSRHCLDVAADGTDYSGNDDVITPSPTRRMRIKGRAGKAMRG